MPMQACGLGLAFGGTLLIRKNVALPRIELGSGASETLILSIVLQSHGRKCKRNNHCFHNNKKRDAELDVILLLFVRP